MDDFVDKGWRPPTDKGPVEVSGIEESTPEPILDDSLGLPKEIINNKREEPVDSMLTRKNVENVLRSLFENAEIFTAEIRTGGGAGSARINVNKKYVGHKASLIIWG